MLVTMNFKISKIMKNYLYPLLFVCSFIIGIGIKISPLVFALLSIIIPLLIIFYPKLILRSFVIPSWGMRIFFLYLISFFLVLAFSYSGNFNYADRLRDVVISLLLITLAFLLIMRFFIYKDKDLKRATIKSLLLHTYIFSATIIPFILIK